LFAAGSHCLSDPGQQWLVDCSRWSEARGVSPDDVCYLRQAHLFQRFWLGGLDTDISRDDDRYLSAKPEGDRFPDLERCRDGSLSTADAGDQKAGEQ